MKIEIISATPRPLDVIAIAAGTSYGKSDPKPSRVEHCFNAGHLSVFEHASVSFRVEGISRACSHQLVRHRLASYCQKSQRYTKIDTSSDDWYVTPPSLSSEIKGDALFGFYSDEILFRECMDYCAGHYNLALDYGIKPEDARYLLPEATKTDITCTMNVRTLFHFLDMRTDSHAQWEIRDMANELVMAVSCISPQWSELMQLWSDANAS